jgi:hypothetical protein
LHDAQTHGNKRHADRDGNKFTSKQMMCSYRCSDKFLKHTSIMHKHIATSVTTGKLRVNGCTRHIHITTTAFIFYTQGAATAKCS